MRFSPWLIHGRMRPLQRRGARAAEWNGLENRRSESYRGFKSHSLRKNKEGPSGPSLFSLDDEANGAGGSVF